MSAKSFFPPGTLATLTTTRVRAARRSGALQSIATDLRHLDDDGVRFLVRVLASLRQKERETHQRQVSSAAAGVAPANPFLPHDPRLFVADLSPTHFCLLNKFNVVDGHLLLVTRAYEDQDRLLTVADLEAMAIALAEIDGLGFFNGGTTAGASQPHKHLQLVPLPLEADGPCAGPAVPIEPLLAPVLAAGDPGAPRTVPGFAFRHAILRIEGAPTAIVLDQAYRTLLAATGLAAPEATSAPDARPAAAYNLLVTRRWMLIVPRSRERVEGISLNALGYAGSLFVRDEAEMAVVELIGPLRLITAAALLQA